MDRSSRGCCMGVYTMLYDPHLFPAFEGLNQMTKCCSSCVKEHVFYIWIFGRVAKVESACGRSITRPKHTNSALDNEAVNPK